ncbi:hypothetical protein [Arthrobacter sp. efr-133-TYG-118]|uniref:hypothetical protein n=1 Tax=Arthrobacter sp. efr-133-TYG-118 TaxID=3040279 RepID=UPI00254BAB70|nr:hypothetical protein [Arthrobacter sp. efr-133-TYG-118]
MSESWYEVVHEAGLEQGDIFFRCPIYRVERSLVENGETIAEVIEEEIDVIVLTQTCDLENNKVDEVLVATVTSYAELVAREGERNPTIKSKNFRKAAVDGVLPPYAVLQERQMAPGLAWSLVDFHNLFSMPKTLLTEVAFKSGERLRLVPPYKEHLAQAFARYIMRVGLPSTLHDFVTVAPG